MRKPREKEYRKLRDQPNRIHQGISIRRQARDLKDLLWDQGTKGHLEDQEVNRGVHLRAHRCIMGHPFIGEMDYKEKEMV